jgi:LPXTG-motif cell wall-anchored protein
MVVLNSAKFTISNYTNIDITANKTWEDTLDHSKDSVEFTLYRSHTKSETIPSDKETVETVTLNAESQWTYTWEDQPNGTDDGKPWYYYIEETNYTVSEDNDNTYTAYYVGNGLSKTGTINVYNASSLTITKVWKDSENKTITNPPEDEVKVEIYRSLTSPTSKSRVNNDVGVPKDSEKLKYSDVYSETETPDETEFVLSKDNNWSVALSADAKSGTGKTYYYYVVETTKIPGYTVSTTEGATSPGKITVTNKSSEVIDSGVTLPMTGGTGAMPYLLAGGAIAMSGAAYGFVIRRRKKSH